MHFKRNLSYTKLYLSYVKLSKLKLFGINTIFVLVYNNIQLSHYNIKYIYAKHT